MHDVWLFEIHMYTWDTLAATERHSVFSCYVSNDEDAHIKGNPHWEQTYTADKHLLYVCLQERNTS